MRLSEKGLRTIFHDFAFSPNESQWPIYRWMLGERFGLVAGGERAGKSRTAGEWAAAKAATLLDGGLLWIVGAEYEDAKPEFGYVFDSLSRVGGIVKRSMPQQGPRSLETLAGVRVRTKSAHEPEKLGREAPDGILMCEAGRHSYESYLRLMGRAAEKRAWIWISGTFESSVGWYAQWWKAWQAEGAAGKSFSLPTWSNTAIFPGGREDAEILRLEAEFPTDRFSERFAGVPVPPRGLVFKEFSFVEHVRPVEWVQGEPVQLWIDPGYAGAYAVEAVQVINGFIHVFDEVYEQYLITDEVINLCATRPWWRDVDGGVIDIAGRQRSAQSHRSPWDTWKEQAGLALSFQQVGVLDGVDRTRTFLRKNPRDGLPRLVVDPGCKGLIGEMSGDDAEPYFGGYRYKVVDGQVTSEKPEDRNNHACKALAYGLVGRFGTVTRKPRERKKQRTIHQVYSDVLLGRGRGRKVRRLARMEHGGR